MSSSLLVRCLLALTALSIANASQEFQVYRMQQYDMPFGNHLGSRANLINMEARTLGSQPMAVVSEGNLGGSTAATAVSRKCVLVRLGDFTLEKYRLLVQQYAGAILIILPRRYTAAHRELIRSFEHQLLREEVKLPVYFLVESDEVNRYYAEIDQDKANAADKSAFQALVASVMSNGFQFVVSAAGSQAIVQSNSEFQAVNLQAKLNGANVANSILNASEPLAASSKVPTIIITAHYDTFGMATSLSYGCDSNGSGVVALLEIARLLSSLYANSKTVAPFNILFLLTAEGKFNYHGLKKWIEEHSETNEMVGKIDLDDVLFAICLDSLGKANPADVSDLFMHVSRPPKEGQASYEFLKSLEKAVNKSSISFETNHKKINLANEQLAWEHERFSLNKIPAFTISHFQSFKDAERVSMTDTIDAVDRQVLKKNIAFLTRAIVQFIYRNDDVADHLLSTDMEVSEEFVNSWMEQICSVSRSASLLSKNHPLITNLFAHFNQYLQEAVKYPVRVQSKEPEFVFYNEEQATLVIYSVKPAIFDLFLVLVISGYIGLVYLFVTNFGLIFSGLSRRFPVSSVSNKSKSS